MGELSPGIFRDARKARHEGAVGIARRQRARLTDQIAYVRAHSRYYRELYQHLPERVEDVRLLPVTDKQKLMERFDDWVTDPELTLEYVRAHADDPHRVGEKLLGKYTVTTSSGTTGRRAFFVMSHATRTTAFTVALRGMPSVLTPHTILKLLVGRWRTAMLVPTSGHFASHVVAVQQRDASPRIAKRIFPVTTPMPELVEQLNAFRPVYVECYPTIGALLASEQEADRLRIRPALLRLGGEGLAEKEYERIRTAFGAKILDLYGANEFPALMVKCPHGWYHTHDDWMVFEPVDANYQPTPPGEQSHTVLVSVLYRREQPILRYDVGDSILVRPDPCPCGSPFRAVKVRGRVPILLNFRTADGRAVTLSSFVVRHQVEFAADVELFQIIQTTPSALMVRLQLRESADPDHVWQEVHAKLARMLSDYQLGHVIVDRGTEPPELSPSGKFQSVIPFVADET
ncbi:MAG: phenylacetate--CoA ligase family protein [Pseudonocardiaceae bacterium]